MSKEIWNLGRVCGFSAYELYLRYIAIEAPGVTPATEKEWLSSMLTMGNSMLLRIGTDNVSGVHYRDIPLPVDSKICASNTIFASYFAGSGAVSSVASDYTGFATRVTDYGPLIENTTSSHPSGSTVPPTSTDTGDLTPEMKTQIPEYLKIIDGIIIQPGTWSESDLKPPYCDFKPDLTGVPTIRISFKDKVNVPFFILLTGFSNKFVVQGVSGTDTATGSQSPDDGDFLGPWVFPWAAKIIFSIPPAAADMLVNDTSTIYTRTLPASGTEMSVTDVPIIDMKTYDPATYYSLHFVDSDKPMTISQLSTSGTGGSILATYWLNGYLPCALYGTTYPNGTTGDAFLYPIDTVAPGTVKLFEGDSATTYAEAVISDVPHNTPFFRDDEYVIYQINTKIPTDPGRYIPISEDKTIDIANLSMYNTRYLWFFRNASEGNTGPTTAELKDVKYINCAVGITGRVSEQFITDYCVSYTEALAACAVGHICDGNQVQQGYINQLVELYGSSYVSDNFVFFFERIYPEMHSASQEGMFVPVNKDTRAVAVTIKDNKTMHSQYGLNFSGEDATLPLGTSKPVTTDIMGAYWNLTNNYTVTSVSQGKEGGGYVFQNHPVLHNVVKDFICYNQPLTATPKAANGFNDNFVAWMSTLKMADILGSNISEASETLTAMGIHSDYLNIDVQSFMQYAATERDMSKSIAEIESNPSFSKSVFYLYDRATIMSIADPNFVWAATSPLTFKVAAYQMSADMSTVDFYRMNPITINAITVTATEVGSDIQVTVTMGANVTSNYTDSSYHVWGSSGQSGTHETLALSLIDNVGSPLSTSGASGTIGADMLAWSHLLDSLGQNMAIDLLGEGLRGMKSSGYDYIQLGNGLRLYLSSTEPTGTIPEGSLGIGWGGIKVYTSGAWVTYT